MSRKILILCLFPFFTVPVFSKGNLECRVVTDGLADACNPYSSKLIVAKEIKYRANKKELIIAKTLPVPKKETVKVISVIDMMEKYVNVAKPIRYEGSKKRQLESMNIESKSDDNRQSLAKELDLRRVATLEKLKKTEKEAYTKYMKQVSDLKKSKENIPTTPPPSQITGEYKIEKGDTLSTIAEKFCLKTGDLQKLNNLKKEDTLTVGKKLILPIEQEMIDVIASAEYTVKSGDTIGVIAKNFNLSSSSIIKYNRLDEKATICIGKKLVLPFTYKLPELEKKRKKRLAKERSKDRKLRIIRGYGKRKLRVTATAYSSHHGQTDKTPFLAAWNNRIRPGMKIIAVSRDMLTTYGLRNGSKVRISGLSGLYTVRDKMNKRYRKRIDIYMGVNRRRALRWGRRSVVIHF